MKRYPIKGYLFIFLQFNATVMIDEFKKFIVDNNLIKPGDKILLTVSGGIDSMVMTWIFHHLQYFIGIAHCNFSLRGQESDKDEELVHNFASEFNIPFHCIKFETKAYAIKNGISVQMAARELRYKWFEEIRKENNYDRIAVAHNLNDNIETLLINLARGTGLAGMSGMKPVNNRIIRPLLFATRNDITEFRNLHNIEFREDRSNADTKYTRNKIRHQILPLLKEINPSIETTLNETAQRFSGLNDIVSEYITGLRESMIHKHDPYITFNISALKNYLHNKIILYELFKPFGITNALSYDLARVIEGKTGGMIITGTHRIIKNRNELIVSDDEIEDEKLYRIENVKDFQVFHGISSAKNVRMTKNFKISSDPHIAFIDSQKVVYPLVIRKWKPGDNFYPLGMNRKKKLSDYFVDNKYSKVDKENIFILESDGKIVWIIGDRLDNRFRITDSTKNVLIITSTKDVFQTVHMK